MRSYFALIDEEGGKFGISFPDLPGCVAMADSLDEAADAAREALTLYLSELVKAGEEAPAPRGFAALRADKEVRAAMKAGALASLVTLPAAPVQRERVNVVLNKMLLGAADHTAESLGETRSGFVEESIKLRLDLLRKFSNIRIGSAKPANMPDNVWEFILKNHTHSSLYIDKKPSTKSGKPKHAKA